MVSLTFNFLRLIMKIAYQMDGLYVHCTLTSYPAEYDPNKHCGVWISENQRHCTHSLTCKVTKHLVMLQLSL